MQEELKFLHKPEIDYEKLSNVAEYFDKLMQFNDKYGMNLEYTPKARWKPGTYDKIKKKFVEIEHPQWTRKRGANNLRKLFEHNEWNARNFRDALHRLDDMMAQYRYNGQMLVDGDTLEQGKALIDEVYNSLSNKFPNIDVEVTPFPYWNKSWYDDGWSWDKPFVPYLAECNVLDFDNDGDIGDTFMFNDKTESWKTTNPRNWWVNIMFKLNDVNLRVYLKADDGETDSNLLHTQPYGEILLGLSIPLYDYCLGRRAAYANTRLRRWMQNLTFFAYQQPAIPGLRHPYIYRDDQGSSYTLHRQTRNYGLGNLCLGDWNDDILKQIFYGNLGIAQALLRTWSEVYYIHSTGPLNTLHMSFAGNHKDWSELTQASIGVSPNTCETTLKHGYDETSLLEDHCVNCTLANNNDCAVYKRMTYTPREIPGIFDEWADTIATQHDEISVYAGLKVIFTRLYNTTNMSPECIMQHALFSDGGATYSDVKGHIRTSTMDALFQGIFLDMRADGYEFSKENLDLLLKVMERIFYDYRFRQAHNFYGASDAIFGHWVGHATYQSTLEAADAEYPIDELQSTIYQIEYSGGAAELMQNGMFKKTASNDFITYLKITGRNNNE